MQFSSLAGDYLRHAAAYSGYSPNTVSQYDTTYRQFAAFLLASGRTDDLRHFTDEVVQGFTDWLLEHKVSTNTIRHRLTALSSLAQHAMRRSRDGRGKPRMTVNPTKSFDWPQRQVPETRFLYAAELRAFLELAVPLHVGVARELFIETGLRVSELIRANIEDVVETDGRAALSVAVKGRGRREERVHVPLSSGSVALLKDWFLARTMPDPGEPLLVTSHGKRWTRAGITEAIRRLAERAGIRRIVVRPHVLRHTANVIARSAGLDPYVRSKLLNHRSPASLERYEHLLPAELHEARDRAVDGLARYLRSPEKPQGTEN
jgi:integrase/recombinase XerD